MTDRYSYDAWGNLVSHVGSIEQPYQYVGKYGYYTHTQDSNLKLMQLGVRLYDAETGMFVQRDPATNEDCSRYVYVEASPLNGIDFDGKTKYTIPIRGIFPFKICYRNLYLGKCIRHSYLLIDGFPIGYDYNGVGQVPGDVDDLKNGNANCRTLKYLKISQMTCLRGLLTGATNVPGNWGKGWFVKRGGSYCVITHDCFDWTRAALSACGLSQSIPSSYNDDGNYVTH